MKVVVSSTGRDLDAEIDPRFGRCAYFILVDTDTMAYEVLDNANASLGGGAGIQAAQLVASKGAKAVITGNCGPNAVRTLNAAGVQVIVGRSGTVRDAVWDLKAGRLKATTEPNVADHFGMGAGMGRRGGMGRGEGLGRGGGMAGGMGCRKAGRTGMSPGPGIGATPESRDQEIRSLKDRIEALQAELSELQNRIKDSPER